MRDNCRSVFLLFGAALISLHTTSALADVQVATNVSFTSQAGDAEVPAELTDYLGTQYADDRGGFRILHRVELDIGARYVIERATYISKYQTAEEISTNGNLRVYVNAGSSTLKILQALVVLPGGDRRAVDPATIQVVDDQEDRVFSDNQVVVIPWPGLEAGAIVIMQYERTHDTKKSVMPWNRVIYPRGLNYHDRFELQASWQADELGPNWSSSDPLFDCTLMAENRLRCSASEIAPFQTDDSVNYYDRMPQIAIARKTGWNDIGATVRGFVDTAMSGSPDIIAKAREVTKTAVSEQEKLSAIHEFVARDVRYVGLEHGNYSHVPRPSQTTLSRRYGDCKDMTTLLLDLLRAVDIEAYPVLVSTDRNDPEQLGVPAAGMFNHLIACGELSDGGQFCLDPTDAYTPASNISSSIQGAVVLKLRPGDDVWPEVLQKDKFRWAMNEDLRMNIFADGRLFESLEIVYIGPYASFVRAALAGLQQNERVEWVEEDYSEVVGDRVKPEFEIDGVDSLAKELKVKSEASYDDLVPTDTDLKYVENAPWLDRMLGYFVTGNEHYDYEFAGMRYRGAIRVEIDPKWTIDRASADLDFKGKYGSLTRTHEISGQEVIFKTDVELPERRITVGEIESFNSFIRLLQNQNHFKIHGDLKP